MALGSQASITRRVRTKPSGAIWSQVGRRHLHQQDRPWSEQGICRPMKRKHFHHPAVRTRPPHLYKAGKSPKRTPSSSPSHDERLCNQLSALDLSDSPATPRQRTGALGRGLLFCITESTEIPSTFAGSALGPWSATAYPDQDQIASSPPPSVHISCSGWSDSSSVVSWSLGYRREIWSGWSKAFSPYTSCTFAKSTFDLRTPPFDLYWATST